MISPTDIERDQSLSFYARRLKRLIDIGLSLVILVPIMPIALVVAVAIVLSTPGPVLFRQERLGRNGSTFQLLKFRTMMHVEQPRAQRGEVLPGNPEVTRFGRVLRRCKLDEIPQLINVLRGDMSLVGPRPALASQLAEYDAASARRLLVRPGLTGLAQINGNIHLSWPERWRWDVEYVATCSFMLDCRIMVETFLVVLRGDGHRVIRSER